MARLSKQRMSLEVDDLEELLSADEALDHLRVRTWGDSIILYSGERQDRQNHARLTWLGGNTWGLSLPRHAGGWDRLPVTGTLETALEMLRQDFALFLEAY